MYKEQFSVITLIVDEEKCHMKFGYYRLYEYGAQNAIQIHVLSSVTLYITLSHVMLHPLSLCFGDYL